MNLPNKLTLLRIIMVPFFVVFMAFDDTPKSLLAAAVIFAAASLTDMLDGKIARKYGLITNFGKLMDPLADKILVMSAMVCFVARSFAPAWVVVVILAREFLVTSLRLIAAAEGTVIAADNWGKIKTVTQMAWVIWTLVWLWLESTNLLFGWPMLTPMIGYMLCIALMYASVFFTVLSGANYVIKNKALLFSDM